jgi:3-hydroxyisobutyrate dehydrogenase-like beta-hydroxyacid dehydrogenase
MVEVLQASSFHSPLFLMKGELVEKKDYAPRFKVSLAEKDQRLVQEAASDLGTKVPINEAVRSLLRDAAKSGRAEKDVAAVAEMCLEWVKK